MLRFAEKVKKSREALNLSQEELAQLIGTSRRTVVAYESGKVTPHDKNLRNLASSLGVTTAYLTNDASDDPEQDIDKEPYIKQVRDEFGSKGAKQIAEALKVNAALFAGGTLTEEQKDNFYEALTSLYLSNRRRAREARKKQGY
ncbi:MAG: helix-turn-helix transcriptional regulator [Blautia sp.]|nr:helix-turn-helix transcriptional regulator [Blautia sp.]